MKNKIFFCISILLIFFFRLNISYAEKLSYEAGEIEILDNGNLIKGNNKILIEIGENIKATGNQFQFLKDKGILKLNGNINFQDIKNKVNFKTEEILYFDKLEKFSTSLPTIIEYNDKYLINLNEFEYLLSSNEISSKNNVKIQEINGSYFEFLNFKFNLNTKEYYGEKLILKDKEQNEFFFEKAFINLEDKEIIGKDLEVKFDKNIFNHPENDPRIKARSLNLNNENYILKKGVFTSCKKNENCPPWSIYAEEINYKKKPETINYKNAWLKIYDIPIMYFPKFSHPSPLVDRKSGFLAPKFKNSSNLGTSIDIPYFYTISDSKDLTFKPRLFFSDEIVFQNEYRQIERNSNHIIDLSLNPSNYSKSNKKTKLHFFSNSKIDFKNNYFDKSDIEINLQKVNNDEYLKLYKIENSNIKNNNNDLLHSFINFNGVNKDILFSSSFEIFEDLTRKKSDRFEIIYPSYSVQKYSFLNNDNLLFNSYGNQKKYNTNISEQLIINDFLYNGDRKILNDGFVSNLNALIKNVNINAKNSSSYKDKFEQSLLTSLQYSLEYPLEKFNDNSLNYFIPKISLMYSPNKSKNLSNQDNKIDINNIYSFNRINSAETVEGGTSITLGANYSKQRKSDRHKVFNLHLANSLRLKENLDLPINSTLGRKTSDTFGELNFSPNKIVNFDYRFAIDNNYNKSNYDSISTNFSLNKFITTFEYSNDKINNEFDGYTSNKTKYIYNKNISLDFNIRRNNETSATEFYNLIYNYTNDCLTASLSYNKEFYKDSDLQPEKQLFFSINLIPFNNAK